MEKQSTSAAASRQLIELSLTRPPVHSFNRQLVRIVIDTVGAAAATLWLLRENQLILCEEIEESVGAIRGIRVPEDAQQRALRTAFEKGDVVTLRDAPAGFDPLAPDPSQQRSLVFIPVMGLQGNLGVLRLILEPAPQAVLAKQVQLAETLSGYYSLYSAQRILTVQHEERRDIDRLSKAILQLQHYTFSRDLPDVIVNSGIEVARIDRTVLLAAQPDGSLRPAAVSSVAKVEKKGAWARLVCELGEVALQLGQPVHYFDGVTQFDQIQDEDLRQQLSSYALMTEVKSLLIYPLSADGEKVGVLLFESFGQEGTLTAFERVLCTVYASHAASALANYRRFRSMPLSRFYAKRVEREEGAVKRGRPWVASAAKWSAAVLAAAVVVWLAVFYPAHDKVVGSCFVMPETMRVITAKAAGEVEKVEFEQGDRVQQGKLLIKLRTDQIETRLSQELENASNISAQMVKTRGQAESERDPDKRSDLLAQVEVLQHSLKAKEEETKLLRSQLDDCFLRAPIDGTILEPEQPEKMLGWAVREGESLCRLGTITDRVKIRIAVPAARIAQVQPGLEARIRLRPLINEQLTAPIETVAERSVTYKNSNVFMADVVVSAAVGQGSGGKAQYLLKPGMTGKARIVLPGETNYLKIYGGALYRKLKYWLY